MVGMPLRILFSKMWGAVASETSIIMPFPLKQKIWALAGRSSIHLDPIFKGDMTQKGLRRGTWNIWLCAWQPVLLQLNDHCIRTRRHILKCRDFLLSRFLQELPHCWDQLTMTQQDIVNKKATKPTLYFPTGWSHGLSAVIFAWIWQLITGEHVLRVHLNLATMKLR